MNLRVAREGKRRLGKSQLSLFLLYYYARTLNCTKRGKEVISNLVEGERRQWTKKSNSVCYTTFALVKPGRKSASFLISGYRAVGHATRAFQECTYVQ